MSTFKTAKAHVLKGILAFLMSMALGFAALVGVKWCVDHPVEIAGFFSGYSEKDFRVLRVGDQLIDREGTVWTVARPWEETLIVQYGETSTYKRLTVTNGQAERQIYIYYLITKTKEIRRLPPSGERTARL